MNLPEWWMVGAFWAGLPVLLALLFCLAGVYAAPRHKERVDCARWALVWLFLGPVAALLWPIALPVAALVGVGALIRLAVDR